MRELREKLEKSYNDSINSPVRSINPEDLDSYRNIYDWMSNLIEQADIQFDDCFVDVSTKRQWVSIDLMKGDLCLNLTRRIPEASGEEIETPSGETTFFAVSYKKELIVAYHAPANEILEKFSKAIEIVNDNTMALLKMSLDE